MTLTGEDDTDTTLGARLLADLRDVFGHTDRLHGETILNELHKISEVPWGDYFGRPACLIAPIQGLLRSLGLTACVCPW